MIAASTVSVGSTMIVRNRLVNAGRESRDMEQLAISPAKQLHLSSCHFVSGRISAHKNRAARCSPVSLLSGGRWTKA